MYDEIGTLIRFFNARRRKETGPKSALGSSFVEMIAIQSVNSQTVSIASESSMPSTANVLQAMDCTNLDMMMDQQHLKE